MRSLLLCVSEEVDEGLGPEDGRGHDDDDREEEESPDVPSGGGVLLGREVLAVAS